MAGPYFRGKRTVLMAIVEYFRRNPDEELWTHDVFVKLDGPSLRTVQKALGAGVRLGWLECAGVRFERLECASGKRGALQATYRAGPRIVVARGGRE